MPRKRKGNPIHGWVVVDKALEMTSTQAVGKTRWLFQAQKAGHAGTLDPLATGVLPIALGEATKTVPFMMEARKSYVFTVTWGANTTTWDVEGEVTETSDHRPSVAEITAVLPEFIGEISQLPPKFSAMKVDGKRAYDLARAGVEFELKARPVVIDDLRLVESTDEAASFEVDCGKGTYVRSLARDLAARLGTCGHVSLLRRTRVGPFTLEKSFLLDALEKLDYEARFKALCPVKTALDDIPVLAVTDQDAADLKQGRAIGPFDLDKTQVSASLILALYNDKALALCVPDAGVLRPKRVFNI